MLDPFLDIDQTRKAIGNKSRRTLYRWVSAGLFPAAIRTGPNSIAWQESTVREWIEAKKQAATQ